MEIKGLNFEQFTAENCCPEQYDVKDEFGKMIGYVRLRFGYLTCRFPNERSQLIYSIQYGNEFTGCFKSDEERHYHLEIIADKILEMIGKNQEKRDIDDIKHKELLALCKLEQSILTDGKINPDEESYLPCKEDAERVSELVKLQEKYNYGWYIAKDSLEGQIKSINLFKEYIINNFYVSSTETTIKEDDCSKKSGYVDEVSPMLYIPWYGNRYNYCPYSSDKRECEGYWDIYCMKSGNCQYKRNVRYSDGNVESLCRPM